jgi:hypothetical protein
VPGRALASKAAEPSQALPVNSSKLCLPVEADGTLDMTGLISLRINIDFNQLMPDMPRFSLTDRMRVTSLITGEDNPAGGGQQGAISRTRVAVPGEPSGQIDLRGRQGKLSAMTSDGEDIANPMKHACRRGDFLCVHHSFLRAAGTGPPLSSADRANPRTLTEKDSTSGR